MTSHHHTSPRVSIIMSVYNGADHLHEAVQSLLAQSYTNFELIIIDDGSTDKSPEILRAFSDPRLKIISQKNSGLTIALNRAIAQAKGEFIARQDADDVSVTSRLEQQVMYLDCHQSISLVGSFATIIEESGEPIGEITLAYDADTIRKLLPYSNQFVHGSLMMRQMALKAVSGYREAFRYSQDYDLVLRMAHKYELANINEPLYFLRHRRSKISLRSKGGQQAYAALARALYQERISGKKDQLEKGCSPEELMELTNDMAPDYVDEERTYHETIINLCLRYGNLAVARKSANELIRISPRRIRHRLHHLLSFGRGLTVSIVRALDRFRFNARPMSDCQIDRITFVISAMGQGGAERVMSLLARSWSDRGVDVTLLTLDDGSEPPFYSLPDAVRHIPLNLISQAASPLHGIYNNAQRIAGLRKVLKQSSPDVVISFIDKTNILALCATRGLGVPVIVSEHSDPAQCLIGPIWDWLRNFTYKWWADRVAVLNNIAASYFSDSIRKKTVILPNPVVIEGAEVTTKNDRRTIISMGRLAEEKRYDLLIKAFVYLAKDYDKWDLIILGEGSERELLETIIADSGFSDRVKLPGADKRPHRIVAGADLYVLSSRFEGFPVALCEAMACGLPVITTEYHSGIHDLVDHNRNGLIVPCEDLESLTDAMKRLMDDETLRAEFGAAGSEIAKTYSLEAVTDLWDTLLKEICSLKARN